VVFQRRGNDYLPDGVVLERPAMVHPDAIEPLAAAPEGGRGPRRRGHKKARSVGQNKVEEMGKVPLFSLLCKISVPTILGMVMTAVTQIVDSVFIGQYLYSDGRTASSAAMPCEMLFINNIMVSISAGCSALLSPKFGEGKFQYANYYLAAYLVVVYVLWVALPVIFLPWVDTLITAMGGSTTPLSHEYTKQYLILTFVFGPFLIANSAGTSALLRVENRSGIAMIRQLIGAIVNLIMDAILFTTCHIGMYTAAISTQAGNLVSSLLMIINFAGCSKAGVLRFRFGLLAYSDAELNALDGPSKASPAMKDDAIPMETLSTFDGQVTELQSEVTVPYSEGTLPLTDAETTVSPDAAIDVARDAARDAGLRTPPPPAQVQGTSGKAGYRPRKKPSKASWALFCSSVGKMISLAAPSYINGLPYTLCILIANVNVGLFSTDIVEEGLYKSSIGVTQRLANFANFLVLGVYLAFLSIFGYHVGARLYKRIVKLLLYTMLLMFCLSLVAMIILVAFADLIIRLFVNSSEDNYAEKCRVGALVLRVIMGCFPLASFAMLSTGIAQMQHMPVLASMIQLIRVALNIIGQYVLAAVVKTNKVQTMLYAFILADSVSGILGISIFVYWYFKFIKLRDKDAAEEAAKQGAQEAQDPGQGETSPAPNGVPEVQDDLRGQDLREQA